MGPADILVGANRSVRGHYRSLKATSMDDGVGYLADAPLIVAARTNRQFALKRIRDARWSDLSPFQGSTLCGAFYAGESVKDLHCDPDFGRQGPACQAYEVFSSCDELLCYGAGVKCTRSIAGCTPGPFASVLGTIERSLADRNDMMVAKEPGLEGYLTLLAHKAWLGAAPLE